MTVRFCGRLFLVALRNGDLRMKKFLITTAVMALTTPALAQMSSSPSSGTATPSSGAASGSMPQTDPGASTAAPASSPSDPKAIIASEYPAYDKDSSGGLNKGEFDTWLTALKDGSSATPMAEKDKTSWLKTAFTTADKDKDKSVSLTELTDYLTAQG
jgi:hypothetical protein